MGSASRANWMSPLREWFRYHFFERKLNSALGFAVLGTFALIIGYGGAMIDYRAGLGVVGLFIAIFLVVLFFRYPIFGLYFLISYSAFPSLLSRLFMDSPVKIEFSNITDGLTLLLACSLFTKPKYRRTATVNFWGNPISTAFLILLFFCFLEAMNPNMFSILGWVSYARKQMILFISFYVIFCLLNDWKSIKYFIYFNIALTTLMAVYACKQQWFGIANFEMRWATASPYGYQLLLQAGMLRKWSTLSDPATSGVLFSSVAMQCIVLLVRETGRKKKIFFGIATIFNMMGYAYSGTRTATLMVVAGIAFYGVATIYEKRTVVFLTASIMAFVILMVMPFSPPSIGRIRSTFQGNKDLSAAVREYDRRQILPYLYQHPMGGGVFTCGVEGPKYNPGHYLTDFQPDSGYMKIFAEQGWIGFGLMLFTYFLIMTYAIHNFYRLNKPELQNHSIALITMIFTLMVGQYSQFAIGPFPQMLSYLGALVFFIKLPTLDNHEIVS